MSRYIIRPVNSAHKSSAWTYSLELAKSIKAQLQISTGLKWKISKVKT